MANFGFPLALLLTFSLLTACDVTSDCDPDNCYEEKTKNAEVEILTSINSFNNAVKIDIYRGNVEEGKLLKSIVVNETSSFHILPTKERLSAIAYYATINGDLEVYNSIRPRFQDAGCEYTCYNLKDGVLDMRDK